MLPVFMLFLIPVGGGIPAGVLLAQKNGLGWPAMEVLYFFSDVVLAFMFEPILWGFRAAGRRIPALARFGEAFRMTMGKTAALYGAGAGPFALVMVAFGVDPMTGRTAAAAAGHGFVSGWAIAITGDMMYFTVIMLATLKLSSALGDPNLAMGIVLLGMFLVPWLVRRVKTALGFSKLPQSENRPT